MHHFDGGKISPTMWRKFAMAIAAFVPGSGCAATHAKAVSLISNRRILLQERREVQRRRPGRGRWPVRSPADSCRARIVTIA